LIIDEVHERSVETDLLCLLCRRLLHENDRIRLVLMSATLASKLYQEYFGVPEPPLKVGARRFPVAEVFLDEFEHAFSLSPKVKRNVASLIAECKRLKCKETPPLKYMEDLYPVVAHIALIVGRPGTSVLVFVPGMNEIVAVTEEIEKLCVDGVKYNCLPIHSDIPFEDQLDAFKKPAPDEVIVIIATNAAESSVTLPAVDSVVCTGLCKQIIYNETSHRQMLMPTWISKASATQRAGRTGRLRPGTVL
jgi:HrpA-like RNA helicase